MKVLVLGAGVVGTAAAWYLAEAGHEVEVIERREAVGLETSFANGGQISACHAEPWANPSVLPKLARWLGRDDAPLVFRLARWDPALWAWGLRFLANCPPGRAAVNTERTLRIALYSRACLKALRAATGLEYDQRTRGILHVYRDAQEYEHAREAARLMCAHGLERQEKTPAQCLEIEPALAPVAGGLAGGILTPDDESGDAHLFTRRLAERAAERGVKFHTNTSIRVIEAERGRVAGVIVDTAQGAKRLMADAYVLAAGSYSPLLAKSLGLRLPIVPAKGYSVTAPVVEDVSIVPTVSVTDDEYKIVCSRLGDRLRVAGTAEMAGWDPTLNLKRWAVVLDRARALFPKAARWEQAEPWAGLRPVTPDSVPLLGATPLKNLWLDTGHGTLGWTMACGSGKLLADLVSGKVPEIDTAGLGLDRFGSRWL